MDKFYTKLVTVCFSLFLFVNITTAQQTHLEIPIIQGNDDAEEVTSDMWDPIGTVYLGSSDLELAWDDGTQYDGMLFRDVQIPAGAIIDSAYVQFVAKAESSDAISLIVYGDKSADADTIATSPLGDISSRTRTTSVLNWSPAPWLAEYDALPAQRTPDLKSILDEIIALDGWAEGNKVMIVVTQDGQAEAHRNAYSFDSDEGTPVLHVWYTLVPEPEPETEQTHLEIPIIQGNDDAEEVTSDMWDPIGTVYLGSSDLELAWDDGTQYDGMLFRDVQIPAGATIDSAYVQFVAKAESSDDINLIVYGDKSADADTIATSPLSNISSRTRTTSVLDWSPAPWLAEYDALSAQRTPDLKSVLDEIIALDGWAEGNKVMIVVTQDGQGEAHRNAYSFDSDEGTPVLHVWFTPTSTPDPDPDPETGQTFLEIPIIQGNDDAEEVTSDMWDPIGTVYLGSSDLELAWDDGTQYDGMLFRDVQIPAGATIDSAYVQFVAKAESSDDINLIVYGDKSADADTIATSPLSNISSRTRTTAVLDWSPAPWLAEYDALPAQRTPDLKSVLSEIIALDGWAEGNKVMIVVTQDGQGEAHRNAYSFDSDEGAPVLRVWFTATDTPTATKIIESTEPTFVTYPNPTEGKLYVKNSSSDQFSYRIYNINGKLVEMKQDITDSRAEINLSNQTKGMYIINIISGEKAETHKIILK